MPNNNDKGAVEDFIQKYGLNVFLSMILAVVGVILILWSKYSEEGKAWQIHLGVGLVITGAIYGVGSVLWTKSQEEETTPPPADGEVVVDQVPAV